MSDIRHISASGVKSYSECPKQFYLKYLSDIEPPEREEPDFFKVGNTVHDTIENILKENPDAHEMAEEDLLELFRKEETTLEYDYPSDESSKVQSCLETAASWITDYVTNIHHVEEEWTKKIGGRDYIGFADLVADLEYEEQGIELENVIVDWKTGKDEDKALKEQYQSGMYIELFRREYDIVSDAAVFVYVNEGTQHLHRRISDGDVKWNANGGEYWENIQKVVNQIQHSENVDEWEAKPERDRCHWCNFKLYCADSGIGAENVEPYHFQVGKIP